MNLLSNKEDSTGEIRDRSLHGTRETVFSCRCPGSHNEDITTADCPMRAFSTLWRFRTDLYLRGKTKFKPKTFLKLGGLRLNLFYESTRMIKELHVAFMLVVLLVVGCPLRTLINSTTKHFN